MCLWLSGCLLKAAFKYKVAYDPAADLSWVAFALLQITGLSMMTTADISVNFHMRGNKRKALAYTLLHMLSIVWWYVAEHTVHLSFDEFTLVQLMPWMYLIFRWTSVLDLEVGYPTYTDLFVMFLVLGIIDVGTGDLTIAVNRGKTHSLSSAWPNYLFALLDILKAAVLWFVYTRSTFLEGVNSRFYTTIYVYLLLFGGLFFFRVILHNRYFTPLFCTCSFYPSSHLLHPPPQCLPRID
jgi:hypothetical protein